MSTKQYIIEKSVEIFNEKGVENVSTNHIAKECGISPGNLYYHYKNKEEIVRKIYEIIQGELENIFFKVENLDVIEKKYKLFEFVIKLQKKYLFFFQDITMLLKKDQQLKQMHKKASEKKNNELKKIFYQMIEKKYIYPMDVNEIELYIEQVSFVNGYWLTYLALTREIEINKDIYRGFFMTYRLIESKLTNKGQQSWNGLLVKIKNKFGLNYI